MRFRSDSTDSNDSNRCTRARAYTTEKKWSHWSRHICKGHNGSLQICSGFVTPIKILCEVGVNVGVNGVNWVIVAQEGVTSDMTPIRLQSERWTIGVKIGVNFAMIDTSNVNLLLLVEQDTKLKKVAGTNGGEWAGPCPLCGGTDRFRVWPHPTSGNPRMWCRQCGFEGDPIAYLQKVRNATFKAACEYLMLHVDSLALPARRPAVRKPEPPVHVNDTDSTKPCFSAGWQADADVFVTECFNLLQDAPAGQPGRDYLSGRGFDLTIAGAFDLGYNPTSRKAVWAGLDVWLPRGIVIPWLVSGQYWNVRIRRMPEDVQPGQDKYIQAAGGANGLYRADAIAPGVVAVMCEGEFNAVTIEQHARRAHLDNVIAVGTGSCMGARVLRWVTRLALADRVLTAFDPDEAGRKATAWWSSALGGKVRSLALPDGMDVNDMARAGEDVAGWLRSAA